MKRPHAITPTDTGPKPDRDGIYPAATWRQSNPHWDAPTPVRHSADGRSALVCGGIIFDASRLGVKG